VNKPYDEDPVPFNLYACLVCAIEHAEGREPVLTPQWIENAKQAVREHEKRVKPADMPDYQYMYPEVAK
jgi:hypothetical protein